jgi:hypothetical protein
VADVPALSAALAALPCDLGGGGSDDASSRRAHRRRRTRAAEYRSAGASATAAEEETEEGEAGDEKAGAEEEVAAPTTKSASGQIGNGGAMAYDDLVVALVDALAALAAQTAAESAAETAAPDSNLVGVSCAAVAAAFAQGAGYGPSGLTKGLLERCDGRHSRTTKPARLLESLPGVVRYTPYDLCAGFFFAVRVCWCVYAFPQCSLYR